MTDFRRIEQWWPTSEDTLILTSLFSQARQGVAVRCAVKSLL